MACVQGQVFDSTGKLPTGCSPFISERTSILMTPFPNSHIDRIFAGLKLIECNLDVLKIAPTNEHTDVTDTKKT